MYKVETSREGVSASTSSLHIWFHGHACFHIPHKYTCREGEVERRRRERKIGYDWIFLAEIRVVNFWLIKLMYALQSTLHGFLRQKTNIWNMSLHFLSMKGEMYFLFVLLCFFIRNNYKSHNSNSSDNIWTNPMCFFFCFTDSLEVIRRISW